MDYHPLISIALCTYNGAHFIEKQLESIIDQTYPNLEIVIVDDCSTDNTVDILRKYEEKHSNIYVFISESNKGINDSFSKAIGLCNGEFIAISDQDDIWLPNKIQDSYKYISDNLVVYSNSLLIDENGISQNKKFLGEKKLYSGNDSRALSFYNQVSGHTMMFRSDLKIHILPIPRCCHYDWWIAFIALNLGSISYLDSPYVMHRIHSRNASKEMLLIKQNRYEAMKRWVEVILSFPKLKYRSFFDELYSILNTSDRAGKMKFKLLLFQIKYSNVIWCNRGFFSRVNRARKLKFSYIPF